MNSFQLKLHRASPLEFTHSEDLFEGNFSSTSKVVHNETYINCVKHSFHSDFNEKDKSIFINICEEILEIQDRLPFFQKLLFIIEPKDNHIPSLITTYQENRSLQDLINKQSEGEIIRGWNEPQKIILLYCLSCFLERLHQSDKAHGRFKASNIIMDNNYYPFVTDLFLSKLDDNLNTDKTIDFIVSAAPEVILKSEYSQKSDIYSFGIISLQIFLQKINFFSDNETNISEIEKEIINFEFKEILEPIPESIRSIIEKCLLIDPNNRPDAIELKKTLESVLLGEKYATNYASLLNFIKFKENNEYTDLKKEINEGKTESIFKYAVKIKEKSPIESLLYFRYAANLDPPDLSSKKYYDSMCRKRKPQIGPKEDIVRLPIKGKSNQFIHLMDDPFFMEKEVSMDEVVRDVKSNYKKEELIDFDQERFYFN